MEKTGIGLLEILALVAILLPLVPVFIIFVSKAYRQDVLALLMILSLVSFIQNLILYVPKFISIDLLFIRTSFQLAQFIILLILLKTVIAGKWLQEGIKILLISFVSIIITIYCFGGIQTYLRNLELTQALLLILITLIALLQLIKSHDIHIFLSPVFWIAGGTFFYYSMYLITQSIPEYKVVLNAGPEQQRKILLLIIVVIQFIFYTIASIVAADNKKEDRIIY
jgi:hypothetical protein